MNLPEPNADFDMHIWGTLMWQIGPLLPLFCVTIRIYMKYWVHLTSRCCREEIRYWQTPFQNNRCLLSATPLRHLASRPLTRDSASGWAEPTNVCTASLPVFLTIVRRLFDLWWVNSWLITCSSCDNAFFKHELLLLQLRTTFANRAASAPQLGGLFTFFFSPCYWTILPFSFECEGIKRKLHPFRFFSLPLGICEPVFPLFTSPLLLGFSMFWHIYFLSAARPHSRCFRLILLYFFLF